MLKIPNGLQTQPDPYLLEDNMDATNVADKLEEHIYAYTHEQDGTYDYNARMAFVCQQVFGVLTALEGEVCILLEDGAGEHLLR